MTLHTKILATLWIVAVVMVVIEWAADKAWDREWAKREGARSEALLSVLAWSETCAALPARVLAAAAILDAVLYGLMWVWG